MRKYTRPTTPPTWTCADAVRLRGREVRPGMVVRITGERGTFVFTRHVSLPDGREWIDVRDAGGGWRSFRPERVRSIPRRQPVARVAVAA
jgi:hypothetical protein